MSTTRQPQGIPVGGQFAATSHAEARVSLTVPASRLKLIADFRDELIPDHEAAIEHWHGRLQDAGVAGELKLLSVDGADTDAGGPTMAGEWTSPEGNVFSFAVDHRAVEIFRRHEWALDQNHLEGSSTKFEVGAALSVADQDLAAIFDHARNQARISDGWASRSTVRSNEEFRFSIPERTSEGRGHEAGEVRVTTSAGDEYILRMDRGTDGARVYGPGNVLLSDRMATAFLTDVSESCGRNTGPDELQNALRRSIEAGTGQEW